MLYNYTTQIDYKQEIILTPFNYYHILKARALRHSPKPSPYFMHYIYLIQNKANKGLYYGYTIDLRRRLKEHNENGEWELIYYEAYRSEEDARKRERKLKPSTFWRVRNSALLTNVLLLALKTRIKEKCWVGHILNDVYLNHY